MGFGHDAWRDKAGKGGRKTRGLMRGVTGTVAVSERDGWVGRMDGWKGSSWTTILLRADG
jgi:hypothetical protein